MIMNKRGKLMIITRCLILGLILVSAPQFLKGVDDVTWPKIVNSSKGELTIYQPQPESVKGTFLSARAAVSVKLKDSNRPVFGAIWITTTLVIDRDTRMATLSNIKVPTIRFSDDIDSAGITKLRKLIEEEIPKWNYEVSVDDIITTLESTDNAAKDQFKNDPPEIIIAKNPTILVLIDGDPILKELEDYDYKRVQNSAFFIIYDPKAKQYYLYGDKIWYAAADLKNNWSQVKNPSSNLVKLQGEIEKAQKDQNEDQPAEETKTATVVPSVLIRTTPAELIITTGEPEFTPIQNTNLLYVKNSENDIFMDIKSQTYFILISGRWYSSKAMEGPWEYVDVNKLPEDFAKIPEGSEKDNVLSSVPGTQASHEAILDNQIPQTAEVDRKTATVTVEYDGEPKFEKVEGTIMLYAINSPQTVLKMSNNYFCVDNGIWFQSTTPKGPWAVSEKRPEEVDNIEPSSPVYNVKYVYIYDVTPDIIYTGYTPGYYGCYVYGPTVIYGTGFYYHPWYGAYYYPRPVTYGFSMHYNPYTGWGMSVGVSYGGFIHVGYGFGYHGGYWGPAAYRPPYHHYPPHGGGYYGHAGRPVHYNNVNVNVHNNNIYANNRNGVKSSNIRPSTGNTATRNNIPSSGGKNNVFADKSGQVYQKTNTGWQTRQGNDWKSVDNKASTATTRPSTGSVAKGSTGISNKPSSGSTTRPSTGAVSKSSFDRSLMDRASQSRARGTTRTANSRSYSSAPSRSAAPSRNMGGGGGRRR
jgi:hypothetical protein